MVEGNVKEVVADRVKIAGAIKNLLANVIDYTLKNSRITIRGKAHVL